MNLPVDTLLVNFYDFFVLLPALERNSFSLLFITVDAHHVFVLSHKMKNQIKTLQTNIF